jgi:indole-3-glycerol phosphate synthase
MNSEQAGRLARILATKREEVGKLRRSKLPATPGPRPFSLERSSRKLKLIGEIKFRSPSAGPLSTALSVAARAQAYERAGADMISVLCDASFFDGAFSHLAEARAACALPLLCKEFVIDESQLDAAAAYGADAVLIIVRCVTADRLTVLLRETRARGLSAFVEVMTDDEATLALDAGATLVGVNARDLGCSRPYRAG